MGSRKAGKGTAADDVRRHAEVDSSGSDRASTRPSGTPEEGKQAFTHEPAAQLPKPRARDSIRTVGHVMRQANSYTADAVPTDVKLAAERRFGAALRMFTPRENGGPYRGRYSIPSITLFRVAPRSVVFHAKER